jgi:hypothetical protein
MDLFSRKIVGWSARPTFIESSSSGRHLELVAGADGQLQRDHAALRIRARDPERFVPAPAGHTKQ